jgi:hypothetical protein
MIQHNAWHALDEYFRGMPGVDNFYKSLQQLFIFKYHLGNITRKQFQIAMGIQQMVWMTDPENCLVETIGAPTITFALWEHIPYEQRVLILRTFDEKITSRYRDSKITDEFLNGTVWYIVEDLKMIPIWKGYGSSNQYYPITETLNFTKIANIYVPELVFGILSDISLTEHIATRSMRPYVANLPTKGICEIHNHVVHICTIWVHEFGHSTAYVPNPRYRSTLDELLPYKYWHKKNPEYNFKITPISKLLTNEESAEDKVAIKQIETSRYMNDIGIMWKPVVPVEGGKKRASRRSSSRPSRRSIAASRTSHRVASHLSVRKTRNNTPFVPR